MPPTADDPFARAGPPVLPCGPLSDPSLAVRWAMIWVAATGASAPDQAVIDRTLSHGYHLGRQLLDDGRGPVEICGPDEIDVVAAELAGLVLRPESWRILARLAPDASAARDRLVQGLVEEARRQLDGPRLARVRVLTSFCVKVGLPFALAEHDIASIGRAGTAR